jgi:recombination protein RecT
LEPCTEQAYLIPFKSECTLVIGYQGYVQLMYRTGQVDQVEAEMIYEADEWEDSRGDGGRFFHRPNWTAADRGAPIMAYSFAKLVSGGRTKVEIVTRERAEWLKKEFARSAKSPWFTNFNGMWQKSPVRQLQKWAPKSAELRRALVLDGATYDDKGEPDVEPSDVIVAEVLDRDTQQAEAWADVEVAQVPTS